MKYPKQHYNPGGMRRFRLVRATTGWQTYNFTTRTSEGNKESTCRGFHGDCIAQGCVFTQGFTVLRIIEGVHRTETFETFEEFAAKYPESNDSHHYRWQDKCCFRCGSDADHNQGPGFCTACLVSWEKPADWPNPEAGGWVNTMMINAPEFSDES